MAPYDCDICGEYARGELALAGSVYTSLCTRHRNEFTDWMLDQNEDEWDRLHDLDVRTRALIAVGRDEGAASYARDGREVLKRLRTKVETWLEEAKLRETANVQE